MHERFQRLIDGAGPDTAATAAAGGGGGDVDMQDVDVNDAGPGTSAEALRGQLAEVGPPLRRRCTRGQGASPAVCLPSMRGPHFRGSQCPWTLRVAGTVRAADQAVVVVARRVQVRLGAGAAAAPRPRDSAMAAELAQIFGEDDEDDEDGFQLLEGDQGGDGQGSGGAAFPGLPSAAAIAAALAAGAQGHARAARAVGAAGDGAAAAEEELEEDDGEEASEEEDEVRGRRVRAVLLMDVAQAQLPHLHAQAPRPVWLLSASARSDCRAGAAQVDEEDEGEEDDDDEGEGGPLAGGGAGPSDSAAQPYGRVTVPYESAAAWSGVARHGEDGEDEEEGY